MDARHQLLLFADRDLGWSIPLRKRLAERGLAIETARTARQLLKHLDRATPDLVILGDHLDDLGGRLLEGLVQERCPSARIIRVFPSAGSPSADEPGPAENVLCSVSRRASVEDFSRVIARVLGCAPRRTQATRAPLVVCVDDDALFLRSLARIIRRQGYRVLTYPDPEYALEELPLVKPDLMILDVLMPGLSGFEVLGEIRQFHPGSVPVVLLSAVDGDARYAEGRRQGAACYLTKPCPPEVLLETVRRLLETPAAGEGNPPRPSFLGGVP
jgi:DNA-binding response OmpR family regulator